jgi:gingipain R
MKKTGWFSKLTVVLGGVVVAWTGAACAEIRVAVDAGFNTTFEITPAALHQAPLTIDGKKVVALAMADAVASLDKDRPELPVISAFFMVTDDRVPQLAISDRAFDTIEVAGDIRPSRGALLRSVDPDSVPYRFGPAYEKDAWYPADKDLVKVSEPFIFREIRGVRVSFVPVQYNPVKRQLRVYKRLRGTLTNGPAGGANIKKSKRALSRVFEPMYDRFFRNFQTMARRLPRLEENGRLVIIAADELHDAVLPLMVWKKKCGIDTKVVKRSEVGTDPAAIKAWLVEEFNAKGFTHVMLVGDAEQVPTNKGENERADSDPCYVKLAGDDHVPDAIISRLSATTPEAVAYQVAKFISYEQFPVEGEDAAFYTKVMGIASNEGSPADFELMDGLRDELLGAKRFASMDQIYDPKVSHPPSSGGNGGNGGGFPSPWYPGFPGPFGPGVHPHYPPMMNFARDTATPTAPVTPVLSLKEQVLSGVNEGRTLINYIGHGSKTSWVTTGFSNTEIYNKLNNGWKLPFIISVACVNGDFARGSDCFCEAWMRTGDIENPRGAIGIFGSTTNQSWVPPLIVQKEINVNYLINDTYKTAGGLMLNGIMRGLEEYGTEVKGEGIKMFEQWHWFGDGTTLVRTRLPKKISVKTAVESIEGESQVQVRVTASGRKPVVGAQVTCYTKNLDLVVSGRTTEDGSIKLNLPVPQGTKAYVTIIGSNLVPIVDKPITF